MICGIIIGLLMGMVGLLLLLLVGFVGAYHDLKRHYDAINGGAE